MRIARGDGRRLRLVLLARVARVPERVEPFFVAVVVFFDPVLGDRLPAALDAEAAGFLGVDGVSEV